VRKRRIWLVEILPLIGAISLALIFYYWPGVTPANFARIRVGMTEREVEALLGGPGHPASSDVRTFPLEKDWRDASADYHVFLWFDETGRVESKAAGRTWPEESLFDRCRRLLFRE
jgi:hypothetical protein